ncbi:MAG: phosphonate metabolism protein PhnP [Opitutales bacterium]
MSVIQHSPGEKLTLLGTGSSSGIPCYGCQCPACTRARREPAHRRQPTCALFEQGDAAILLDAGIPDLAEKLPAGSFHAILLTHFHVDHVQALFHMRWGQCDPIPVYTPDDPDGCADLYKNHGVLDFRPVAAFTPFSLGKLSVTPVPLNHSKPTHGYCLATPQAKYAYLTDTLGLPDTTHAYLRDWSPDVMVLNCHYPPTVAQPRNHNSLTTAIQIAADFPDTPIHLVHIDHNFQTWLMENPSFQLPANIIIPG